MAKDVNPTIVMFVMIAITLCVNFLFMLLYFILLLLLNLPLSFDFSGQKYIRFCCCLGSLINLF